jgi:hypothetical protein
LPRTCLVQLDLDGLQTIMVDCSAEDFSGCSDYVFHSGLDRLLEIFDRFKIRATLFVVGRDLKDPAKTAKLQAAKALGHEFGNHSDTHPRWFKRLSPAQKRREIEACHKRVEDALGVSPRGFRAPGYSISAETLPILQEFDYLYDSSVLPSFYDRLISWALHGSKPNDTTGFRYEPWSFHMLFRKNRPYCPSLEDVYTCGDAELWELPVSCMPFLKFPFHASYVLNSSFLLFRAANVLLRFAEMPVVYLLHLKDASSDLAPSDLARCVFNPISRSKRQGERIQLLERIMQTLNTYEVRLNSEYVQELIANGSRS